MTAPTNDTTTTTSRTLIKQGAEALVYKTIYLLPHLPALLKYRPPKAYRHPILDQRLTRHRCLSEARLLARARTLGIAVPAIYFVDDRRGEILMEWIEGPSVRDLLEGLLSTKDGKEIAMRIMMNIGSEVGKLHATDIIHGDLTTSNVMVRNSRRDGLLLSTDVTAVDVEEAASTEVVLIDFGLGSMSTAEEDKAVDLHVLERAFTSTHPKAEGLFEEILVAYEKSHKGSKAVLRRLQDVRMRGRKRSMIG